MLPETELSGACLVAERIRQSIAETRIEFGGKVIHFTVSSGLSVKTKGATVDAILKEADLNLYEAKHTGRNRTCPIKTG